MLCSGDRNEPTPCLPLAYARDFDGLPIGSSPVHVIDIRCHILERARRPKTLDLRTRPPWNLNKILATIRIKILICMCGSTGHLPQRSTGNEHSRHQSFKAITRRHLRQALKFACAIQSNDRVQCRCCVDDFPGTASDTTENTYEKGVQSGVPEEDRLGLF